MQLFVLMLIVYFILYRLYLDWQIVLFNAH